jgi:hypothetical protein
VVYRWRSADYVQRLGHQAIETWGAVAVRCKIAYCPVQAVKRILKKDEWALGSVYILHITRLCFMIELFFVLLLKGQFYKRMYTFTTCCGGFPVWSSLTPKNPPNQKNRFYIMSPPVCKNRSFLTDDFKILKIVGKP